jgi:hypothetical protein
MLFKVNAYYEFSWAIFSNKINFNLDLSWFKRFTHKATFFDMLVFDIDLGRKTSVSPGTQTTAGSIVHTWPCQGPSRSRDHTVRARTDLIEAFVMSVRSSPEIASLFPANAGTVTEYTVGRFLLLSIFPTLGTFQEAHCMLMPPHCAMTN